MQHSIHPNLLKSNEKKVYDCTTPREVAIARKTTLANNK